MVWYSLGWTWSSSTMSRPNIVKQRAGIYAGYPYASTEPIMSEMYAHLS